MQINDQQYPFKIISCTSGRKTVASAGTAERLVAISTPCRMIDIMAEADNTGIICVGGSQVDETAASRTGIPLNAGDAYLIEFADAYNIWLDTSVNGDGVTYNLYL